MSSQEPYCGGMKQAIDFYYQYNIYTYINIAICFVGMILNLLIVLVFTRKTMNSPPNLILAHLAFVDFLASPSIIAQFWVMYMQFESYLDLEQSYGWSIFFWNSDIFVGTVQFVSAFLTVQLAAWRYIAVVHPLKERNLCTKTITRNVVITVYVTCCVLYTIPYLLSFGTEAWYDEGKTYYWPTVRHPIMNSIRLIVYGLLIRILPSIVLAGLTSRIVITLLARKTHREQLSPSASTQSNMKNVEMRQQTNRSTTILLAVAALFFVAEFPIGILWFLTTINPDVWNTCYVSLVKIFMTIANINSSITFMVYYALSQQFRTTFKSLFNLNKRERTIYHQTHTPLAAGDTEETESGRKTSEV